MLFAQSIKLVDKCGQARFIEVEDAGQLQHQSGVDDILAGGTLVQRRPVLFGEP